MSVISRSDFVAVLTEKKALQGAYVEQLEHVHAVTHTASYMLLGMKVEGLRSGQISRTISVITFN